VQQGLDLNLGVIPDEEDEQDMAETSGSESEYEGLPWAIIKQRVQLARHTNPGRVTSTGEHTVQQGNPCAVPTVPCAIMCITCTMYDTYVPFRPYNRN
jgi:hypothetical protein